MARSASTERNVLSASLMAMSHGMLIAPGMCPPRWHDSASPGGDRTSPENSSGLRTSTSGNPWTEIDFPEDYQRALADSLPAIEADRRASLSAAVGE